MKKWGLDQELTVMIIKNVWTSEQISISLEKSREFFSRKDGWKSSLGWKLLIRTEPTQLCVISAEIKNQVVLLLLRYSH